MADSERSNIPAWQQVQKEAGPETGDTQDIDATEVTLDQARKFLRDENVRNSSIEKKAEFLKSKGFDDAQVQELLEEADQDTEASNPPSTTTKSIGEDGDTERTLEANKDIEAIPTATSSSSSSSSISDSPPIITYPEFLTTSQKPPPLITPSRLANILAISGSIWTLLYGTARFAVSPMVDNLNDARTEYYEHVSERLDELVDRLESAVSEVPYKNSKMLRLRQDDSVYGDDESTFSDPTELFHRDIGVQTSPLMLADDVASSTSARSQADKPIDSQALRLSAIRASLREMSDMHTRHAESTADLNSLLREIRDEVDKVGAPPPIDYTGVRTGLAYGRNPEPDDEVKKTKDAIRSVKGMFLSARSFPATAAR
ncbi:peroxisomal membrane anchor protein conserved region-domain-containing protein [Hypoxylon trugodes]|uniref:peroxisomal membrane anchor protein conserved region-domain-containing protein n=1 Tax=Hypoxylon trugodes TaxID=326681 RepID=UPI002196C7C3|nr:peroxisomal membrane anchor protein conserved region-domain-containing protein [Hypoxylon trugodes]KAI1388460.1 peroxisomal membrane anchor protein conserved region-domain-containing protein [Hypoxylon trugodes]